MSNSKFWRALAIAAVVGLFYLGTSLRQDGDSTIPSLISEAQAGDVGISSVSHNVAYIVTSSDNGKLVNVWKLTTNRTGDVIFVGTFQTKKQ